jgi:hypothetical protein
MGSSTAVSTDTARDIDSGRSVVSSPHLFIAFETRRLLAGSARVSLRNTSFVELVKTDGARAIQRESGTLVVRIPDPTMSRAHAHLIHAGGEWTVTDVGSKNGTFVNGRPVPAKTAVVLRDGDVIEVSRTFLIFREGLPTGNDERPTAGPPGAASGWRPSARWCTCDGNASTSEGSWPCEYHGGWPVMFRPRQYNRWSRDRPPVRQA